MKKCPFCAEDIQDAAIVRKHCKRDLFPVAAPPPTAAPLTAKEIAVAAEVEKAKTAVWGGFVTLLLFAVLFTMVTLYLAWNPL